MRRGFSCDVARVLAPLAGAGDKGGDESRPGRLKPAPRRWLVAVLVLAVPVAAAVEGTVHNGTTGNPAAGVEVALMKLDQGMVPVGSVKTDAKGKFRFDASIAGAHGLLRAQFEGVTYTELVTPGAPAGDIKIDVYNTSKAPIAPDQRVMLVEPSGGDVVVNESYLFRNESQPPVTYTGSGQGTLRFFLPPEVKWQVQVSVAGVGGVPLRVNAEKTDQAGVHKVEHAIKPGESRIDLTYRVAYEAGTELAWRTMYPEVSTRIAAPEGVTLEGEGLRSEGQEPRSKASIFSVARADFRVKITGEGQLPRGPEGGEEGGSGGGESMSIIPAAVVQQRWIIYAFAALILALGFYGLYSASGDKSAAAAPGPAKKRKS